MLTYAVIQILLSALGSTMRTLYKYHYANLVAQVFMMMFNIIPLDVLQLMGILTLGAAAVSSIFSWLLAFVRFWRYLFFPTKENFFFFGECIANFFLITIQAIFFLYQANQLSKERKEVAYKHTIYKYAVAILFFHDFYYGALLFNIGTWYEFFGITQFVVHTLMTFLPDPEDMEDKNLFRLFVGIWTLLLVQHIATIVFGFTDPALSEAVMYDNTPLRYVVWWLASVYIVIDIIFLLNASVLFEVDVFKFLRPYLEQFLQWWATTPMNRVVGKYILSESTKRKLK